MFFVGFVWFCIFLLVFGFLLLLLMVAVMFLFSFARGRRRRKYKTCEIICGPQSISSRWTHASRSLLVQGTIQPGSHRLSRLWPLNASTWPVCACLLVFHSNAILSIFLQGEPAREIYFILTKTEVISFSNAVCVYNMACVFILVEYLLHFFFAYPYDFTLLPRIDLIKLNRRIGTKSAKKQRC